MTDGPRDDGPRPVRPGADGEGRTPSAPVLVTVVAVVVAAAVVALGFTLSVERAGETASTPTTPREVPERVADLDVDLAAGVPSDAEALAGEWTGGADGITVAAADPDGADPLLALPLGQSPWADATITAPGEVPDGWSVAFAVSGPSSYWAATVHPGVSVDLVRVSGGEAAVAATVPLGAPEAPPTPEDQTAEEAGDVAGAAAPTVAIAWRGRLVQVTAAGVELPTVTVSAAVAAEPTIGVLARGAAAAPDAARWARISIVGVEPLGPAVLPPFLDARHVDAAEVRQNLGG